MQKAIPSPNLTAVLATAALADLLLVRLASHVFLAQPARLGSGPGSCPDLGVFHVQPGGRARRSVGGRGAAARSYGGDTIFPRSMRITVSTIGLFFVILASAGVLVLPVPDRFVAYLRISHAFLAGFVAAGLWHRRCPMRMKLAVTLFAAPVVVHTATMFCERMGWSPFLLGQGGRMALTSAFLGLLLSPVLLRARPRAAVFEWY
jgi:hypothetical protein